MTSDRYGLETELPINAAVREAVYLAFDGCCYYSGQKITREESHVDHFIPKAKGGKNVATNFVLSRSNLNQKKSFTDIPMTEGIRSYLRSITAPKIIDYLNLKQRKEKKETKEKERWCVNLDLDVITWAKRAVYHTPGLTLSELVERALLRELQSMERKRGEAFPEGSKVRVGRPMNL